MVEFRFGVCARAAWFLTVSSPRGSLARPAASAVGFKGLVGRINEIVHGKRGITADTALRLARYFGTSDEFWMNLQSNYELRLERQATGQDRRDHSVEERVITMASVSVATEPTHH